MWVSNKCWTYGCELECSDWDTAQGLPEGFQRSPDYTIVNSNGIAAQPNPKIYSLGGEINTPPTNSIETQMRVIERLFKSVQVGPVNHRTNLHLHIGVPGLKDDLAALKQLQRYIHLELPKVINLIEPIPKGVTAAEKKRERRRKVSHHTFLSTTRLARQLNANSCKEFFELEVPRSKAGQVMWHAQPRVCVNLRQLLQTETIEFRHFPGTNDISLIGNCFLWCRNFLKAAINFDSIEKLYKKYQAMIPWAFPTFPSFNLGLEIGYQATAAHNGLNQEQILHNIDLIQKGKFHDSTEYAIALAKAEGR